MNLSFKLIGNNRVLVNDDIDGETIYTLSNPNNAKNILLAQNKVLLAEEMILLREILVYELESYAKEKESNLSLTYKLLETIIYITICFLNSLSGFSLLFAFILHSIIYFNINRFAHHCTKFDRDLVDIFAKQVEELKKIKLNLEDEYRIQREITKEEMDKSNDSYQELKINELVSLDEDTNKFASELSNSILDEFQEKVNSLKLVRAKK